MDEPPSTTTSSETPRRFCPFCKKTVDAIGVYCPRCRNRVWDVQGKPLPRFYRILGFLTDPVQSGCFPSLMWVVLAPILIISSLLVLLATTCGIPIGR